MIQTFDLTIPELSGGELRRAYVWLPDAYDGDPDARFPVLYMFDGQNVFFDEDASFGTSWRMYDYLNAGQPDVIVAAVSCSQTGRMAEYSPFSHENGDAGHVNARGRSTMEWLLGEFKPSIDAQYRTLPDRDNTLIAGSSMGGLMSLYAALDYNGAFSRAACLSPSLWVHPRKSLRMIERARIAPDTCIYFDYGTQEMGNHPKNTEVLCAACSALLHKGVDLTFRLVPGGTHSEESWAQRVPVMMKCLGL